MAKYILDEVEVDRLKFLAALVKGALEAGYDWEEAVSTLHVAENDEHPFSDTARDVLTYYYSGAKLECDYDSQEKEDTT